MSLCIICQHVPVEPHQNPISPDQWACRVCAPSHWVFSPTFHQSLEENRPREYRAQLCRIMNQDPSSTPPHTTDIHAPELPPPTPTITPLLWAIDLEATDIRDARITQLACVGRNAQNEPVKFVSYVKADRPVSKEAEQVTGISDETLKDAPLCGQVLQNWLTWMNETRQGCPVVLVAHNGMSFDFPLLCDELSRWDMPPSITLQKAGVVRFFDSLKWARIHVPRHSLLPRPDGAPSLKLGDIYASFFGKEMSGAHDAAFDCEALLAICHHELFASCRWNEPDEYAIINIKVWINDRAQKRAKLNKGHQQQIKDKAQTTVMDLFTRKKRKQPDHPNENAPPSKK